MRKIPKRKFDSLLTMTRKYYKTGGEYLIDAKIALSCELQKRTDVDWLAFLDLTNSIIKYHGFKPNASNATFYSILNVLGYEVVDDEAQEQESQSL